jgi:hypothetical protein
MLNTFSTFYATITLHKEETILKIEKINVEIEKTKAKITEYQAHLKELERQRTEQENTEIVGLVRGVDMTPQELAEFIRSRRAKLEIQNKKENTEHEME